MSRIVRSTHTRLVGNNYLFGFRFPNVRPYWARTTYIVSEQCSPSWHPIATLHLWTHQIERERLHFSPVSRMKEKNRNYFQPSNSAFIGNSRNLITMIVSASFDQGNKGKRDPNLAQSQHKKQKCENGIVMEIEWIRETMANDDVTNECQRQWSHRSSFHFLIKSISANDFKQFN